LHHNHTDFSFLTDKLFKETIIENSSGEKYGSSAVDSICSSMEEETEEAVQLPVDELICYYGALTSLEASFNKVLRCKQNALKCFYKRRNPKFYGILRRSCKD
jgi:hypothetical protein